MDIVTEYMNVIHRPYGPLHNRLTFVCNVASLSRIHVTCKFIDDSVHYIDLKQLAVI